MNDLDGIRGFLAALRRRLLLRAGLETVGYGAAAMALAALVLALVAAAVGPAGFWPPTTVLIAVVALAAAAAFVLRPARALRDNRATARRANGLLGERAHLASDLLSAVELAEAPEGSVSPGLVGALQHDVAGSLAPIDPKKLVPLRPAVRAVAIGALGCALLAGAALSSATVARGLGTLLRRPTRFEGALVSTAPLVGDVRITYTYPPYTGLPARSVEGSTGDVAAVKGTRVRIETRPLRAARKALLLLGEQGEKGEIPASLENGSLVAELTLQDDAIYRFWLEPTFGRAVREDRGHHLTAEPDTAPRVEIVGPADRLELETPRPIEIGFSASDDFGLGAIDLVYRAGERPEQRTALRDAAGARTVEGRTLWDPAPAVAGGESRIAYRIEARDRDAVSGAKVGTSRTLYLVIGRPHESLEDRLERQRELLEKLISDLANRLEPPLAPAPGGAGPAVSPADRVSAFAAVHDDQDSHLALLGQLLDEDRRNGGLGKALRAALSGVADRIERILRDETGALAPLKGKPNPGSLARLETISARMVAELENDVLVLDDLIGRQRLEDLAALGKELTDTHQRLQDLLARYKQTKDEGLRRQLEREIRDLRSRLADLAQKIAAVKARNDVPEEWRNLPDLKSLTDKAKKLDELLEKGQEGDLEKALAQLGDELRDVRNMLDQNLEGFGAERFPQENRVVAELMKKIGDIEGDERTLQKETEALAQKQEAEIERRLKGQLDDFLKKEAEKVERLKQRLAGLPQGDPESAVSEELGRAKESAKQLRRLLAERDLAEARGEAERAESSLDRAGEHLEELAEARAGRRGGEPEPDKRAEGLNEARALAQEIADDLAKILPRPSETLTPQEREAARAQAERQAAIGRRTDDVAAEAARRLGKMPGMEKAESELRGASSRMREAGEMLRREDAKSAAGAERDAADRLAKLRDSMQERTMGGGRQRRDPVRIPGADESSAPRAWRQELLEAMKEKAPERFRDEVRRYYEELVK